MQDAETPPPTPPARPARPEPDPRGADVPVCSGKGCREPAVWALVWNNPKIHTPERRKVWLACEAHRDHLTTFLDARSFLKEVVPLSELDVAESAG